MFSPSSSFCSVSPRPLPARPHVHTPPAAGPGSPSRRRPPRLRLGALVVVSVRSTSLSNRCALRPRELTVGPRDAGLGEEYRGGRHGPPREARLLPELADRRLFRGFARIDEPRRELPWRARELSGARRAEGRVKCAYLEDHGTGRRAELLDDHRLRPLVGELDPSEDCDPVDLAVPVPPIRGFPDPLPPPGVHVLGPSLASALDAGVPGAHGCPVVCAAATPRAGHAVRGRGEQHLQPGHRQPPETSRAQRLPRHHAGAGLLPPSTPSTPHPLQPSGCASASLHRFLRLHRFRRWGGVVPWRGSKAGERVHVPLCVCRRRRRLRPSPKLRFFTPHRRAPPAPGRCPPLPAWRASASA